MHRCPCPPAAGNDANLDVGLGDIKPHGMAHDADLALDDADLAALDDELAADDNIILVDDDDDDIMHDDAAIDEIALQAALLAQRGPAAWTNVDDEEDGEHVSSSGNDDEFDPSQQAADEVSISSSASPVFSAEGASVALAGAQLSALASFCPPFICGVALGVGLHYVTRQLNMLACSVFCMLA